MTDAEEAIVSIMVDWRDSEIDSAQACKTIQQLCEAALVTAARQRQALAKQLGYGGVTFTIPEAEVLLAAAEKATAVAS